MDASSRRLTLVLVNLASVLERADEALLPAVYRELGQVLGATPLALGTLTFYRALVQALCSPLAAYLALHGNRAHIIGLGAVWWGVATLMVGMSSTFWAVAVARAANGVGLAVVLPAVQSVVADLHQEEHRGAGFGWLHASGQAGSLLGGVLATVLAGGTVGALPGWRAAFVLVALVSVVLGLLVAACAQDPAPPFSKRRPLDPESNGAAAPQTHAQSPAQAELGEVLAGARQVLGMRTFQVIVAQGVVGQIPWNAMVFFTLWLELIGFSHAHAALLVAALPLGNMGGSVVGGWAGDWAARRYPEIGRILCAQFSAGVAVPLAAVLLRALPERVGMGPAFAAIVPVRLRTTVFALDMALEKSVAAAGAPLVGLLAQKLYGFKTNSAAVAAAAPASSAAAAPGFDATLEQLQNATSLARGLFLAIAVPFVVCVTIITGLHWTYPSDRKRARIESWLDETYDDVELVPGEGGWEVFSDGGRSGYSSGGSQEMAKDREVTNGGGRDDGAAAVGVHASAASWSPSGAGGARELPAAAPNTRDIDDEREAEAEHLLVRGSYTSR
eukprot:jgi/Mesen1/3851/ME000207S02862